MKRISYFIAITQKRVSSRSEDWVIKEKGRVPSRESSFAHKVETRIAAISEA